MKRFLQINTGFVCDVCGRVCRTKEECRQCEASHRRVGISYLLKYEYGKSTSVYPDVVILGMEDGNVLRFKRTKE